MNTSNTYETTDKTLFMEEFVDDSVTMTMDDIEKILIYHSKDNGNVPHTPESTMMTLAGVMQKEYAMRRLFSKDVANAHRIGNIHIHNADMPTRLYSMQYSEVVNINGELWPIGNLFDTQRQLEILEDRDLGIDIIGNSVTDLTGPTKISRFMRHKNSKPMKFISLENGKTVVCTEDHPFTINGVEVQAKDLNIGDVLETHTMKEEDWMFQINNVNGFELTKDFGWLMGLFITDGNYDRSNSCVWQVTQKDGPILQRLKNILDNLEIKYSLTNIEDSGCVSLIVYSKDWTNLFYETFGITKGSKYKCLPPSILKFNKEFVYGLISGVVDGDGCVLPDEYGCTINVGVASRSLTNQLQIVLGVLGVKTYCHMQLSNIVQKCTIHGKERMMKQNMPVFRMTFRTTEEVVKSICEHSIKLKEKNITNFSVYRNDSRDGTIKAIKDHPIIDEYVYDFTTDSSHFLINGIRVHNCGGHSPSYVAKYGLSLPNLSSAAKPAKYADVFLEQLIKFAASMQGHFSGAVGFDAVNMFVAPYLVGLSDEKVKQCAQILVYEFAQQAVARGGQVIFSDLNLYWGIPKHYQNVEAIGPGGVSMGVPYKEFDYESKRFMRALMQVYEEGDGAGRPFFFPKADCHITAESVDDEEYMNMLGRVASKMGSPYFVFDRGSDPSISQCCFDEYTKVLVRDDDSVRLMDIKDVRINRNIKVFHNGSWVKFKRVETPRAGKKMFKIRTVHGKELIATEDHLFPTLRGDLRADNLSVEDYVLFNTRVLQNEPHYESGMTYEQGVVIGAFLGDGSFNGDALNFSLDETSFNQLKPLIEKGYEDFVGEKRASSHYIKGKLHTLYIGANGIADKIREWINGGHAWDKAPKMNCLKESVEFRRGIIDGWEMTDGGNSHRIYSISKDMIDGFEAILTSLGIQCRVDVSDRTNEPVIVRGEVFKRNYPIYCLRMYDTKVHRNKEGVYKVRNNSIWFKIESVEELKDYEKETVYCFDVENEDEPYFTMPSGWIVHNCRLKLKLSKEDVAELDTPWTSRFTALQNVTMNLPAFAQLANGNETGFYEQLYDNMMLAKDAHRQKLDFIDRVVSLGPEGPLNLLLMEHDGTPYFRYDKTKFLVGMVGLNEAVQLVCGQQLHESNEAIKLGMKMIAQMNANCKEITNELGMTTILEQTPAESTAYRFARLDVKRFGESTSKVAKGSVNAPYYTNSTYLNVGANIDPIERVKKEGKFHPLIDAGAISHVWLGNHTPSAESVAQFVRKTFYNTQNSQITFSPEFTACNACQKTGRGAATTCGYCGSENVDVITRITGYYSKLSSWNQGKRQEFKDRARVVV